MAETNVINEATEVIENVKNEIPVKVVKSSKTSKIVLGVAVTGIVAGIAVGVVKTLKKRKAAKEDMFEDESDTKLDVEDLDEADD